MQKKEFLGIITARGRSKGIPHKNIKLLAGKPLIQYTFDAIQNCKLLGRCIISTDDDDIIKYAKSNNIEVPFKRPAELATDEAKTVDVLIHAINFLKEHENYSPKYVITLQPTSPLRTSEDIDKAIEKISNDLSADSLVSVVEIPNNYNPYSLMIFDGKYLQHYVKDRIIMRRQDKPLLYARNGAAIYITKTEFLLKNRQIIGNKCLPYFMPKERGIDIDDNFDWKIAEFLILHNGI